jgi:hypothetical protein
VKRSARKEQGKRQTAADNKKKESKEITHQFQQPRKQVKRHE